MTFRPLSALASLHGSCIKLQALHLLDSPRKTPNRKHGASTSRSIFKSDLTIPYRSRFQRLSLRYASVFLFSQLALGTSVDTTDDSGTGSLREAIALTTAGGTIDFDPSLNGLPITLTSGLLNVDKSLVIDASSLPDGITISGGDASQVFSVTSGSTVTLDTLTITGGYLPSGGSTGAGISNRGTLTIRNSTISNNTSDQNGGALGNYGTLSLINSTVAENNAANDGGAIYNDGGALNLTSSTVTGNSAVQNGGGIWSIGNVTLSDSIIAGNSAQAGGQEIYRLVGTVTGTGINLLSNLSDSTLTAGPSILVGDPLLAPLAGNGGPTNTCMLLSGSPAIDAGGSTNLLKDQRGFERALGAGLDLGAYEAAAGNFDTDGLTVYAEMDTALTASGVVFEISSDPNFGATVGTLAGTGISGFLNGPRTDAQFKYLSGVAKDDSGNIYIADAGNHRIRMLTPEGAVSTIAGSGDFGYLDASGTSARFAFPAAVAVGPRGNLYVADTFNQRVRKITKPAIQGLEWSVTTLAGSSNPGFVNGSGSSAQFNDPQGLVVDSSGNVYVADSKNHCIRKVTVAGTVSTFSGTGEDGFTNGVKADATYNEPLGLVFDNGGNLIVADRGNNALRKVTSSAVVSTFATGLNAPVAVTADESFSNFYVSNKGDNRVRKVTNPGQLVTIVAGLPAGGFEDGSGLDAKFDGPAGLLVNNAGDIVVADSQNQRLRRIVSKPMFVEAVVGVTGPSGTKVSAVIDSLTAGLDSNQTYYIRWRALADGSTQMLGQSFHLVDLPTVVTENADNLTPASARLNATVNAMGSLTDVIFEYSTDPNLVIPITITLPQAVAGSGDLIIPSPPLESLLDGSTYYFRAGAKNGRNNTEPIFGETLSFTTPTNAQIAVFDGPNPSSLELSTGDSVDFGSTTRGNPISRSFTISNLGEWDLAFGQIISPSITTQLVQINDGTGLLPQGDSLNFEVVLNASNLGEFTRLILIPSNDPDQPGFEIPVTWVVFGPPTVITEPAITGNDGTAILNATVNPEQGATALSFQYSNDPEFNGFAVTTTAGSTSGFMDGPGASAQFSLALGLATDTEGNIYVADTQNHRIRKITPDGITSTLAGTADPGFADSPAPPKFNNPTGVAVGADGTLYVADSGNHRIRAISPTGDVTTFSGLGTPGYFNGPGDTAQFSTPYALAVDGNDNLYVADQDNRRIRKVSPDGSVSTLAGNGDEDIVNGPGDTASFKTVLGIAASSDGTVYITEESYSHIRRIMPDGMVDTFVDSSAGLNDPWDLAINADGCLFVVRPLDHRIWKVKPDASLSVFAGSGSAGNLDGPVDAAQLSSPISIAVANSGDVIVGEFLPSKIRRVSSTTITVEVATNLNGGSPLSLSQPVTGLERNTDYYFKAFATNAGGTTYGSTLSFSSSLQLSFSSWQQLNFGSDAGNPLIAGLDANPSGDGISNLLKYAFGLDPNESSTTGLPTPGQSGNNLTLTFSKLATANNLNYSVEWSTDLSDWKTSGISLETIGADFSTDQVLASVPKGSDSTKFLRLNITLATP